MALFGKRLAVSIPDTVLEEKESLRDKTAKLGIIARVCAIYGVDVVEVFRDPRGHGEGAWICRVLEYLETPQYLRKRIYPLDEGLRFAGILPPLRIPSHKPRVPVDKLSVGDVREGVVNADGSADVGLDAPLRLKEKAGAGRRVTVRVLSVRPLMGESVARERAGTYWGYVVEPKSMDEVFSDARFGVKIATSRFGEPMGPQIGLLRTSVRSGGGVKLIFGSPSRGLFDMAGKELEQRADFVLNLFQDQQVETVRTEEAIFAGLGLVNLLMVEKA